jgi:hypothetical protein
MESHDWGTEYSNIVVDSAQGQRIDDSLGPSAGNKEQIYEGTRRDMIPHGPLERPSR